VSIVVPSRKEDPRNQSATSVFSTAGWHEREAYDLVGIDYEGHPDLRRILLPETWQGHPSLDYDRQPAGRDAGRARRGADVRRHRPGRGDRPERGLRPDVHQHWPHHPATHGVLHLETRLDGEQVAHVEPDIGYLHRCEEQMCQQGTYRHKIIPYADRWDYTANMPNEWAPARAIEDLADIEVPEYAQVLRTMATELGRMLGHFLALATYALDIYGDFTAIFQYGIRDRETVQSILEDLTGQRMMFYFRVGGVAWDLPTPRQEFIDKVRQFIDELPGRLEEYHHLITNNELYQMRTVNTGIPRTRRGEGTTASRAWSPAPPASTTTSVGTTPTATTTNSIGRSPPPTAVTTTRLLVRDARGRGVRPHRRPVPGPARGLAGGRAHLQSNVPRTLKPESDSETYKGGRVRQGRDGRLPSERRDRQPRPVQDQEPPASTTSRRSPRWPRAR